MGLTMKSILVATDGSDDAHRAVDYAAELAKITGASLLIVNVIGGYGLPSTVMSAFTHVQHAWLEELLTSMSAKMLTEAQERARKLGVATIQLDSRSGDVVPTILEIALEKKVDMIVAGKRGVGRIAGLLIGSTSQKLVSLAPVPVTVVP